MATNNNLIAINGKSRSGKDTVAQIIQFYTMRDQERYFLMNGTDILHWLGFDKNSTWLDIEDFEIHRFADKLKQIVSLLTGIPRKDLEDEDVKSQVLPQEWNYISKVIQFEGKYMTIPGIVDKSMEDRAHTMTVRQLLQKLGTNACRNNIHENIWINALFSDYIPDEGYTYPIKHLGGDQYQVLEEPKRYSNGYPKWVVPDMRFKNEFHAIEDRGGLTLRVERDYDKKDPKYNHQSETDLDDYRDKFHYIIDNNSSIEMLAKQVKTILQLEKII